MHKTAYEIPRFSGSYSVSGLFGWNAERVCHEVVAVGNHSRLQHVFGRGRFRYGERGPGGRFGRSLCRRPDNLDELPGGQCVSIVESGIQDAFVTKLNPGGNTLAYSTY